MAGFLFDYTEGYLRVCFSPEAWGDFRIDFHFLAAPVDGNEAASPAGHIAINAKR